MVFQTWQIWEIWKTLENQVLEGSQNSSPDEVGARATIPNHMKHKGKSNDLQACLISQIGKSLKNQSNQNFAGSRSRHLWFIAVPRALCGLSISNRWVSLIFVYSLCFSGCSRREPPSLGAFLYALCVVPALLASGQGSLHSRCISLCSRRFSRSRRFG